MKKALIIISILVAILLIMAVFKDAIVRLAAENAVRMITGLKLRVADFKVGLLRPVIDIKGLVLFNPKGYPDKTMVDMPGIFVDYDLAAIIKGNVHLRRVHIDLREFTVVKNSDGDLNLDSLKVVRSHKQGVRPQEVDRGKAIQMQIDELRLKVGRVLYKDYSRGPRPVVREFNVNINERYTNISDPYALVSLIVVRTLTNTTISQLANFDIGGLKATLIDTLYKAETLAAETATMAQETIKSAGEGTGGIISGATDTVTKTAQSLFQLPFAGRKSEDKQ